MSKKQVISRSYKNDKKKIPDFEIKITRESKNNTTDGTKRIAALDATLKVESKSIPLLTPKKLLKKTETKNRTRTRSKRNVRPSEDDITYMRTIVKYHNERKLPVNAERVYAYASGKIKYPKELKKDLENAFGGKIPKTKRFPPGKDKIQFIQANWQKEEIATIKKKKLMLVEAKSSNLISRTWKVDMVSLEKAIKKLEQKNDKKEKFDEIDFYRFFALKQACESLPTKTQLNSSDESVIVRKNLLELQLHWAKVELDKLDKLRKKQLQLWVTSKFKEIEKRVVFVTTSGLENTVKVDFKKEITMKQIKHFQSEITNSVN